MQQFNKLSIILNEYLKWNKARMDCFVGMLIAKLKIRTINLFEDDGELLKTGTLSTKIHN